MKRITIILVSTISLGCHQKNIPTEKVIKDNTSKKVTYKDETGKLLPDSMAIEMLMSEDYHDTIDYRDLSITLFPLTEEEKFKRNNIEPKASPSFKTGAGYPSTVLRDMNNVEYHSKDLKGKILVINYWFINCPPCRR